VQEQVHSSQLSYDFLGVDFPRNFLGTVDSLHKGESAEGLNDAVHEWDEHSCNVSISLYDRLRCQVIKK